MEDEGAQMAPTVAPRAADGGGAGCVADVEAGEDLKEDLDGEVGEAQSRSLLLRHRRHWD